MNYRFFGLNSRSFKGTTTSAFFKALASAQSPIFRLYTQMGCQPNTIIYFTEQSFVKYRVEVEKEVVTNGQIYLQIVPKSIRRIDSIDIRPLYGKLKAYTKNGVESFKAQFMQGHNEIVVEDQTFLVNYIDNQIWQRRQQEKNYKISQLSDDEIRQAGNAKSNSKRPKQHMTSTITYDRDEHIAQYTKKRAQYKCQICGWKSTWQRNGQYYIEVHHLNPLANGGTDHWDNMVALCPNCHSEIHNNPTFNPQTLSSLKDLAKQPW